jgi:NAD(P)-dependent dehydrogenase (short-subunit alcohol dehydrogenase family)
MTECPQRGPVAVTGPWAYGAVVTSENLFDLSGRVALVTGGNSGIGLGMADALAAHGASVAIWGTNPTKNAEARAHVARHGRPVLDLVCDVGDEAAVDACFARTVEELGRVDSVFANAGVSGKGIPFAAMPTEEWHRVLRVNLDGVFFTLRAAVQHMVARGGGGSLVVSSSGSAYQGQQKGQHYGASKAGIIAMANAIAVEHARDGIRANSLIFGWIESAMTEPSLNWPRFAEKVKPRIPLRRWGQPGDTGGIAVYLASDASRWHTGDVITVDGGYAIF